MPVFTRVFILIYSITVFWLLDYQSLWVDELMQLAGTRNGTLSDTERITRTGVGGVPLGWLPQLLAIQILGYSSAIARLPSALASVGCCFVLAATARRLHLRYPALPVVLLSVVPLQFRYALEGRPYAQGLLLSTLATLVFIRLIERTSPYSF
jgi:hypothetical protein